MEKELDELQLQGILDILCNDGALDILWDGERTLYIPFIMNDAAEAYCILRDVVVPGTLPEDFSEVVAAEVTAGRNRAGARERSSLRLRTADGILIVIWYGTCIYSQTLYQYHRIMHCWVAGDEHMRMLVNTIGTIRDKLEYLGKDACNEAELALIPLIEYRPFRHFSPISESIERWYPETRQGFEAMKAFVREAGDEGLLRLMQAGRLAGGLSGRLLAERISRGLAQSGKLFSLLYRKLCEASSSYEERRYPEALTQSIDAARAAANENVLRAGYTGAYPVYRQGGKTLLVFEEHPFTVPEMDDLEFEVHLLEIDPESEGKKCRVVEM